MTIHLLVIARPLIFHYSWMKSVDDRPGLCVHVLTSLEERKRKDPSNYSDCVLMVDEMAIKQQVTYVPSEKRKVGYVDLGGDRKSVV